ncbi:hypothetical protein [Ostreiculturibacter nitratireducens]|uniref:hypothetical protein n=1 Tax=Ostreiculturibacter nitratireducens TaxID=3075226 RepID=UPI0031B5F114
MFNFSIGLSFRVMRRTAPFVLFRIAVYFGIAAAYVVVAGTGAGIGWLVGAFGDEDFRTGAILWGGAIGFGAVGGILYFLREYILYLVKAGHIAVMIEVLEDRPLPRGENQIEYAWDILAERFGEVSVLFGIDQIVKAVLRAIIGLVGGAASLLPVPALGGLMRIIHTFLKIVAGLMDEVILAHAIRTRSEDPYSSARAALVLYSQNAQPMMVNAAWLTIVSWVIALAVFFVMLAPAAFVVWVLPGTFSTATFVFAVLFAWAVKAALIEPFVIACMLQAFFSVTEGQVPKSDWIARLGQASAKFRKLSEEASGWAWKGSDAADGRSPD